MKNHISFRTELFDSKELTPKSANKPNFGEDLAKWMSGKAKGGEFSFGSPTPALHGWSETVNGNGEKFVLGFDIVDSYIGLDYAEWQITIDKPRKWKMFGSKDSPSRDRLCDLIHNILRDERKIREVQWSD